MQRKVRSTLVVTAASGLLVVVAGLSGCSMFSPANQPVDCNIVKTQAAAGQSDAQIASNLSAQESEVAACHGPATTGNTNTIVPEKGY
jgi:hypothetical protein